MLDRSKLLRLVLASLIFSLALTSQATASARLLILVSNDDGYDAPGIAALEQALAPFADVVVSAPATDQSGVGHSLTIRGPIVVQKHRQPNGAIWYKVAATPATCVRMALEKFLSRRPDLVVSGINRGANLGPSVYYSGTVGAAREAVLSGLPALAVSLGGNDPAGYRIAAEFTRELIERLRAEHLLNSGMLLNVNVPLGDPRGVRVVRMSFQTGAVTYEPVADASGHTAYRPGWRPPTSDDQSTDLGAFTHGYVTVTPLRLDETAERSFTALRVLEHSLTPAAADIHAPAR